MGEKMIYEMGLVGVDSVLSKIASVNAAFENISTGKLVLLGKALDQITGKAVAAAKAVREIKTVHYAESIGSNKVYTYGSRKVEETLSGNRGEVHFSQKFRDMMERSPLNRMVERIREKTFNANVDELKRRNREYGIFGYGDRGMARILHEAFARQQLALPFYSFLQSGFDQTSTVEEIVRQRHNFAEALRMRMRDKMSKVWPIVPVGDRSIVPRGTTALDTLNAKHKYDIVNTGRVTDPGYVDAEWRTVLPNEDIGYKPKPPSFFEQIRDAFYKSNSPRSLFKNLSGMTGAAGTIGKIGMWGMAFNLVMSSIAWFGRSLKRAADAVRDFGKVILQATESWRQQRESHAYATSMDSLAAQWRAQMALGGDAASASALWNKLTSERAMLPYGGNGGAMMEAARLFGLNILGSNKYGFATNDELMRNIAERMSTMTNPEDKVALGNLFGLNPYQFWMVSHGTRYYDYLANKTTLTGFARSMFSGDESLRHEIYSKDSTDASRMFEGAWGDLVVALKELGGILGEALLPLITMAIDTLQFLIQIVSMVLKPIAVVLNKLFSIMSARYAMDMEAMNNTPTLEESRINNSYGGNRNVIIKIDDIALNNTNLSSNSSEDDVRKLALRIWNKIGEYNIDDRS